MNEMRVARIPEATEKARLKDGVHIEYSPRRVRTYFGGELIADSERVLLVYESKRPPAYWFPVAGVRMQHLKPKEQASDGVIRWHISAGGRIAENAARAYATPADDRSALND